ncbi:hypothetical protein Golob_027536, partial [Gossypium lobatum]|nr:hypothetical protein [Gossypium lobatum]
MKTWMLARSRASSVWIQVELFVTGKETRSWTIIVYWGSSDNLENVISISDKLFEGSKSKLIRRIQQILASKRNWSLRYVLREKNKIANALAKMTLSNDETLHMFKEPPMEIKEILDKASFLDNSTLNIPMIDDLFDQFRGALVFLTIDLRFGYHRLG